MSHDDAVEILREAAQRATPGPWWGQPWGEYNEIRGCRLVSESVEHEADAEFIVAARNHIDAVLAEVVRLRAQVEAVKAVHKPISLGGEMKFCAASYEHAGHDEFYPCSTIRLLEGGSDE